MKKVVVLAVLISMLFVSGVVAQTPVPAVSKELQLLQTEQQRDLAQYQLAQYQLRDLQSRIQTRAKTIDEMAKKEAPKAAPKTDKK